MSKENKPIGVRNYLMLSFLAAAAVGVIVWGAVKERPIEALIWAGITFVVVLVSIATLALTVKDDDDDPDQPKLK
ncbi:MAG: hypothetical protein RL670_1222 [Actinomycetota bacterium]